MKQSIKQAPSVARKSGYNPHKYRRQVRQLAPVADGVKPFTVRSMTRNDGTRHNCGVDTHNGAVFCDCGDFYHRHAKYLPTLATPAHWCKHVAQAVQGMARRNELHLVHDAQGTLCGAVVLHNDAPTVGTTLDAEHDDYAADLVQRQPLPYGVEVESDDPGWLERAASKYRA